MREKIEEFLARYPFDLVLMSVHFLRDWPGENWVFDFAGLGKPLPEVYHEYFSALKRGIRTGLYDAVAHLDLIRQPGHPVLANNARDVEEVLTLAGRGGHEPGDQYRRDAPPAGTALPGTGDPAAGRHGSGMRVITGSDAHEPHLVGYGFSRGAGLDRRPPRPSGRALPRAQSRTPAPAGPERPPRSGGARRSRTGPRPRPWR